MRNNKCGKCDAGGYLAGPIKGSRRSCPCGFAIAQQERAIKHMSLAQLIAFMEGRSHRHFSR